MAQLRSPQDWGETIRLENRKWKDYRINGRNVTWSPQEIDAHYAQYTNDPLPRPGALRFFENRRWNPQVYRNLSGAYGRPDRVADFQPVGGLEWRAQQHYRELVRWFGVQPTYTAVKSLGVGGAGMAVHFQYRSPLAVNVSGKDIVVKVPLESWQDYGIEEEKRMMRVR